MLQVNLFSTIDLHFDFTVHTSCIKI